jgi:preprotein translocase subunit SecA
LAGKQTLDRLDQDFDRYESMLKIDKHALDDELIEQPQYYSDVSQRLATTISYRDEAKAEVEGTRAMIDQQIRREAVENAEKITESAIGNRVIQHPEYQKVQIVYAAWTDRYNRWMGLKESIIQRGYALKDLVALFAADYWVRNSAGGTSGKIRTVEANNVKAELREKRRERSRL